MDTAKEALKKEAAKDPLSSQTKSQQKLVTYHTKELRDWRQNTKIEDQMVSVSFRGRIRQSDGTYLPEEYCAILKDNSRVTLKAKQVSTILKKSFRYLLQRRFYEHLLEGEDEVFVTLNSKEETVFNNQQVVQLGYQRVKEDGTEFCKPRWVGKLANGEFHEVSLEWVEENFSPEYINKLRGALVNRAGNLLHHIPPGNCRKFYPKVHPNAPPIGYRQDSNEFCFVYALCNAVCYYLGNKKTSNRLECFAKRMSQSLDCYEDIEKVIKQNIDGHIVDILCHPGGTGGESIFDPLSEISNYITLIVPQGTDGSCRHAVATVGRWAFESNQHYAQFLSRIS